MANKGVFLTNFGRYLMKNVYLLVCHVPFLAKGAVRILHRARNGQTAHDRPTNIHFFIKQKMLSGQN